MLIKCLSIALQHHANGKLVKKFNKLFQDVIAPESRFCEATDNKRKRGCEFDVSSKRTRLEDGYCIPQSDDEPSDEISLSGAEDRVDDNPSETDLAIPLPPIACKKLETIYSIVRQRLEFGRRGRRIFAKNASL